MNLSIKSIQDLRNALKKTFGAEFDVELSDDDIREIGNALLVVTAEHLKLKAYSS